jgi:hypothetical protein
MDRAKEELKEQTEAFEEFSAQQVERVPEWKEQVLAFEADNKKKNPYEVTQKGKPTLICCICVLRTEGFRRFDRSSSAAAILQGGGGGGCSRRTFAPRYKPQLLYRGWIGPRGGAVRVFSALGVEMDIDVRALQAARAASG